MRLIDDADVIIKALDEALEDVRNDGADLMAVLKMELFKNFVKQIISYTPTVGTDSVVRCKDCIHNGLNRKSGNFYCDFGLGLYQLDDFCSKGERKE